MKGEIKCGLLKKEQGFKFQFEVEVEEDSGSWKRVEWMLLAHEIQRKASRSKFAWVNMVWVESEVVEM